MSESIKIKINNAIKNAMKAQDKKLTGTLRFINASFKQYEVDEQKELTDEIAINLLNGMLKKRRASIDMYKQADRNDLVVQEEYELEVIKSFLPEPLTDQQIQIIIQDAIKEVNAASIKDMSKVLNIVKPKVLGRADLSSIGSMVKSILGN